jgi:hypothetical protein
MIDEKMFYDETTETTTLTIPDDGGIAFISIMAGVGTLSTLDAKAGNLASAVRMAELLEWLTRNNPAAVRAAMPDGPSVTPGVEVPEGVTEAWIEGDAMLAGEIDADADDPEPADA